MRNYGAKWQKDADFNGLVFPGTSENQVIFWLRNMEKPQCCGLVQQIQEKPFGGKIMLKPPIKYRLIIMDPLIIDPLIIDSNIEITTEKNP